MQQLSRRPASSPRLTQSRRGAQRGNTQTRSSQPLWRAHLSPSGRLAGNCTLKYTQAPADAYLLCWPWPPSGASCQSLSRTQGHHRCAAPSAHVIPTFSAVAGPGHSDEAAHQVAYAVHGGRHDPGLCGREGARRWLQIINVADSGSCAAPVSRGTLDGAAVCMLHRAHHRDGLLVCLQLNTWMLSSLVDSCGTTETFSELVKSAGLVLGRWCRLRLGVVHAYAAHDMLYKWFKPGRQMKDELSWSRRSACVSTVSQCMYTDQLESCAVRPQSCSLQRRQ